MLTPAYKKILRPALPLALAAALGAVLLLRLGALAARDAGAGRTVIINEVCAKNLTGYTDADGRTVPWLELRNVSGRDLDLSGYTLSNDPDWPDRYTFPDGTFLAGSVNDLLLLAADGQNYQDANGLLHIPLTLRREGETLTLYAPDGSAADTLRYDELPYDMTCGRRFGDAVSTGYFAAATPGAHNPAEFWQTDTAFAELGAVGFSTPGGFYEDTVRLTLRSPDPEALILYTTDGSEPTADSLLYTGPITVRSRAGEPNVYAAQPAALQGGWLQNYAYRYAPAEVDKCTTVTARLYKDGALGASVTAQSYWVGVTPPTLPTVSLTAAPGGFFGPRGIYSPGYTYFTLLRYGQTGTGNFNAAYNVPGSISVLDAGGAPLLQDRVRVHVSGGAGRTGAALKNLHIRLDTARTDLLAAAPGGDGLTAFVLRGSGSGAAYPALHQDAFLNNYLYGQDLGTQLNVPVALFLQGEYWGTYTVREIKNRDFFRRHFGVEPGELICPGVSDAAVDQPYKAEFGLWVDALDGAAPDALAQVEARVDVEEYIRYVIAQMYTYNSDGMFNGGNNSILWRVQEPRGAGYTDGRWRFLLNDLDTTLIDVDVDPFAYLLEQDFSFAVRETAPWFSVVDNLFQKLWQSADFRTRFAAVFREEMATTYAPENLLPAWDAWCALLRPELGRDLPRQTVKTTALAPLAEALTGAVPQAQTLTAARWEADAAAVREYFARRADTMLQFLELYLAKP